MMIRRVFVLLFFLWLAGFFWFVETLPHYSKERESISSNAHDAIVVLTGGMGRVGVGAHLLHQKAAPKLFITGVGVDVKLRELVVQDIPASERKPLSYYQTRVELGYVARTTAGNAREVNGWMVAHPIKSMVLVTSNYHMPRSLYLFRHAFPHIEVTPYPTFGPAFSGQQWWRDSDVLALAFSEYHKLLMSYVLYDLLGARLV